MELQSIGPSPYVQPQAQRDELRETILELIHRWIRQKPGLDPRNYIRDWRDAEGRSAYRSDARSITTQLHHARAMLRYIELRPSISGADLAAALTVGGRLSYTPGRGLDYTTGQYWPMEFRAAACRVMASVLWDRFRADIGEHATGDAIHRAARRELGATIARRWFR
jgi:hypothetical protein